MSIPEHTDPLTDRPREPDELRRLNLEQDSRGGSMWPWIVGIIAVIFVVSLYGYKGSISNTASTPPSSSSSTTTGSAQPAPPQVNPLAATPTPVPAIPPTNAPH